jgi:Transposase family tnp2
VASTCDSLKHAAMGMVCMDQSNCMMALLYSSQVEKGRIFLLEPLIEELLKLWSGAPTYDAFSDAMFQLHAAVIWCIHDYPALSTHTIRGQKVIMHAFTVTKTRCHDQ